MLWGRAWVGRVDPKINEIEKRKTKKLLVLDFIPKPKLSNVALYQTTL